MVRYCKDCRYLESHEWIRVEGEEALIGISDYAQEELNDIVYVELPEVGDALEKSEEFGTVESVKAASELYMPASGEILAVNEALEGSPELANQDPYGDGWMLRIRIMDPHELEGLLSVEEYRAVCEEE
jgi:glycine cleavage system H protein